MIRLPVRDFIEVLRTPFAHERFGHAVGEPIVVIDDGSDVGDLPEEIDLACVVIGVRAAATGRVAYPVTSTVSSTVASDRASTVSSTVASDRASVALRQLCDVIVDDDDHLALVASAVAQHPVASTSLAILLRHGVRRSIADGLEAESAVYSTLQAGVEFAQWQAARSRRTSAPGVGPPVTVDRTDDVLTITLRRPRKHNAFSRELRDELIAALMIAAAEPALEVHLRGEGPSFCSGGDLDEFGSFSDPAAAHLVRLSASAARAMAAINNRTTVFLHGACMGAGIELAAFAHHVVATPDVRIALPEISLGLIPGAGGTVSIPRRIGRHRTAWLALTGTVLNSGVALEWGLVDSVQPTH